jgi:hypothetical protein
VLQLQFVYISHVPTRDTCLIALNLIILKCYIKVVGFEVFTAVVIDAI